MAKFYGIIGFAKTGETSPGVWEEIITERNYYMDVIKVSKRIEESQYLNSNLQINNDFSILADPYILKELNQIRYVIWQGTKWKVTTVTVEYPRLRFSIGGVYNEQTN